MASKEQVLINIQDDNKNSAEGTMFYTAFSAADRTTRAITALVVCWILAGVTVFIPIVHFFLVPAFFIAGPVMAYSRYKQTDAKEKVDGTCPRHHGSFTLKLETTDKLPKWAYCPECDGSIQFVEKN